jgi:hypothetical protein
MRAVVLGVVWLGLGGCASDAEPVRSTKPPDFVDAGSDVVVAPTACNLADPRCPSAASKCSVVQRSDGYVSECVPEYDTRGVGEPCERSAVGHDECAAGSLCSRAAQLGDAPSTFACRTLCTRVEHCSAPERCYHFSLNQPEVYGVCVPECQPIGSECGPGRHCIFVRDAARVVFGMCDDHGGLTEGSVCNSPYECAKGMACAFENGCRVYCDPTHPCADSGRSCVSLNFPEFPGLGLCMPQAR